MSSPWRYACPEGHTAFRYRSESDNYYCRVCRRNGDNPVFDEKIDRKTGEQVAP